MNAAARLTTRALLARLRPAHPRRRVPRPQPPTRIEESYTAALRRAVCEKARACFADEEREILSALVAHRRARGITDAAKPRAALVLAFAPDGRLLLGKRRDNGKWTLPGGGINPGESPRRAAVRELEEETTLVARSIRLVESGDVAIFRAEVEGVPTGYYDPDHECSQWRWFDPAALPTNLHGPAGDANVLRRLFPAARADMLPILIAAAEAIAALLGESVATAAAEAFAETAGAAILEWTESEIVSALVAAATELGITKAGEYGRHAAREATRRALSDTAEDDGKRIGREAAEALLRSQRARAGQTGKEIAEAKAEAAREARKQRARAGSIGAELAAASEEGRRAADAIDRAARRMVKAFDPVALKRVVRQFGERTDDHSRAQLDAQLRSAIGVPLSKIERQATDKLDGWAAANVDLIVTVPERYFDRIRLDVLDAFEGATHPSTLAEQFVERYGMSERDAERIARDQVLKLNADLTHDRLKSLGVERATWRTMRDNRVSDDCLDKEGVVYDMATGIDGEFPGSEHPMCRCWGEPDFSGLVC